MTRFFWAMSYLILSLSYASATELQILLPLGRVAYQTNERIDLSVVRSDAQALNGDTLSLTMKDESGGKLVFTFLVNHVPVKGNGARSTEHLHLNGWLLRPGRYDLEVSVNGAVARTSMEVYTHLRKSSFKLIDWGSRAGQQANVLGENSLGFNLLYADSQGDASIRGGLDYMGCCVMGGGHQMDLRMECDWSDPGVLGGARARAVRAALQYRTQPNAIGVHFYDEPGLTWWKNPKTGVFGPHDLPAQVRSYEGAFGTPPLSSEAVKPDNSSDAERWQQWARWKLGFMDAAWKDAQFGVSYVRPDLIAATQSQYAWTAFTDGYYFNVARSLPVTSGHGGYDDIGPGYYCPSWFLEMARVRDLAKPCWYLPTWYGGTKPEAYRLEQYLSFITGIQGMAKPPDMGVHQPSATPQAEVIVETNRTMARLGTIFTTMKPNRAPVAVLYSLSHLLHQQTNDRTMNYAHADRHGTNLALTYLALKMIQEPMTAVVEEDILDGTVAAHHKAVVLTSIRYLDTKVQRKLESFIAAGGHVFLTGDCTVNIKGAVNLGVTPRMPDQEKIDQIMKEHKYDQLGPYTTVGKHLQGAAPLAKALSSALNSAGIKPAFRCDQPGIVAARHVSGDVEYLFAVNATYDRIKGERNSIAPAKATIGLPADGRPIHDAVLGGQAIGFARKGPELSGVFRFGPGQMRVFARTSRPIRGVSVTLPAVICDYTSILAPLHVDFNAMVANDKGSPLSGSVPLSIRVTDPWGTVRYDLLRATEEGVCRMSLPLACNDLSGRWTVSVQELLSNTVGKTEFFLEEARDVSAVAGVTPRAVCFGDDRDRIFRLVRNSKALTIVTGAADYNDAAAQRLANSLKPWNVKCTIMKSSEVKPRDLSEEEARTFVGIDYRASGQIKAGRDNPPDLVGYDLSGPVVLLGTPQDNALIATVLKHKALPYTPSSDFPGRGRGMIAWQLDMVGQSVESVCLIASNSQSSHDAEGMSEAVGSFYEAAAGIDPLTPLVSPDMASIEAPTRPANRATGLSVVWQVLLPDRAVSLKAEMDRVFACSWDGSKTTIDAKGKILRQEPTTSEDLKKVPGLSADMGQIPKERLVPDRIVKSIVTSATMSAVAYWGGTLQTFDASGNIKSQQLLSQDVCGMAWVGSRLVVGLADGRVVGMEAK